MTRRKAMPDTDYPEGAVVMCMRTADSGVVFADNVRCPCADCGEEIHHRPYVPAHTIKVCMHCVMKRVTADEAKGEPVKFITPKRALDEVKLFHSKGRKQ
jgi:hypothetical protein